MAAFNGSAWSTQYWHKDHLGSINVATDDSAAVQERLEYEPFGKRRYPNGTTDVPGTLKSSLTHRGFTGHEELDEVGLVHMNGRVYDPSIGRFASADPFVQAPFNPQSLNRYSYVINNPLSLTDPTGYEATGDSSGQGAAPTSAAGTDDGSSIANAAANPSGFDLGVDNNAKSPKANADANVVAPKANAMYLGEIVITGRRAAQADVAGSGLRVGDYRNSQSTIAIGHTVGEIEDAQRASKALVQGFFPGSGIADGIEQIQNANVLLGMGIIAAELPGLVEFKAVKGIDGIWRTSKMDAAKMEHIFSVDHVKTGIMDLAKSKEAILSQARDALMAAEKTGALREGMNTVVTRMNGYDATVRAFIKNGEMQSMNVFKGVSERASQYVVDLR